MPAAIRIRTTCTACRQEKSPDDFHRSVKAVSGRKSVCKMCKREHARQYRTTDRGKELNRAASARRRADPAFREELKLYWAAYRKTEAAKAYYLAYKERNPVKVAARQAVRVAVRAGKLQRCPCAACGADKAQAHHEDYSKPLMVGWFCSRCHARLHAEGTHHAV